MDIKTAVDILDGDKSVEQLVELVKKLTLLPAVNTFDENRQLKAAKTLLSHKKAKNKKK